MTPSNHDLGFRPSHFPALEKCIHQEQKEGESEARERGKNIHAQIAAVMRREPHPVSTWNQETRWAVDLITNYQVNGWNIFAVEQPVDILDEDGQVITQGTIDLVLERNREYLIIDWKTGDK